MQIDFLIIGQGISGTWLSYYLEKAGKSFIVIDNNDPLSSSRLAAGVINPVTGRRHVEVWMADKILPFAKQAYEEIGSHLQVKTIRETSLIDFFPSPQMRQSFMERVSEKAKYVQELHGYQEYNNEFNFDFGAGIIKPVYIVQLETLLPAWRNLLLQLKMLREEKFELSMLETFSDYIKYHDIEAKAIIFCDGVAASASPYFNRLPFAPNKGEILLAEITDLAPTHIFKKGLVMVPLAEPGQWWIGSNYAWEFENSEPTMAFRESTEAQLRHWIKHPFKIISHHAGIRPATLERRPFVGMHPQQPLVGILNGMGTKGCSLAPYFAKQLMYHLCSQSAIDPEADIKRFQKILLKNFI